jgi:glycine/sarcosine N-methyltransferase
MLPFSKHIICYIYTFAPMDFYKNISDYYDSIFPTSPIQADFVKDSFSNTHDITLLDVGCGTANLCISLAPHFKKIIGIDPDESMLDIAREKAKAVKVALDFLALGMLDIEKHFNSLDGILCLGNTLVHLNSKEEILAFLKQARSALHQDGKLLMQIINYDRIIDRDIRFLPTIENDGIKFIRNYHYDAKKNSIDFETILSVESEEGELRNLIQLYPIRKEQLKNLLKEAGFGAVSFYGNFKRDPLSPESIPMVLEATL